MLSPFMACEEAWLLIRFIREVAPDAALAMGLHHVIIEEELYDRELTENHIIIRFLKMKIEIGQYLINVF